ncbi:MAG: hypothetical protein K9I29_02635 [Bacteroidales bacterium]|nr:hypothetical protein [Bacteroidales bacterium]
MTKSKDQHRYYLHYRCREFTRVDARRRQIEISERIVNACNPLQKKHLQELQALGYNLQHTIE